jgi:PIN domain nuclease of toxin-antitoxin system
VASILLDTNIVIPLVDRTTDRLDGSIRDALNGSHQFTVSVVSLWEIAIKVQIGKLPLLLDLDIVPDHLERIGVQLLDLNHRHVLHQLALAPSTKDPFDRLLLSICEVDDLCLLTTDRALSNHPLAWPAPA